MFNRTHSIVHTSKKINKGGGWMDGRVNSAIIYTHKCNMRGKKGNFDRSYTEVHIVMIQQSSQTLDLRVARSYIIHLHWNSR